MNSGPLLFLGLFVTMAISWLSFVMAPQLQIGGMQPTTNIVVNGTGVVYPNPQPGTAHQGAEVYRAEDCAACHTQQVLPRDLGSDIIRGWGIRRSTGYDYLFDQPVMLGSVRVGPDLANVGRRVSADKVLLRLYDPRAVVAGSTMPSYRFLFDNRRIQGAPSPDALQVTGDKAPAPGFEIVPRPEARALVAYIMSLHQNDYLFEAPPPFVPGAKTNAPAPTPTNSPAQK
jgi:cytochrome c oxidase cbb3-type subunit II